MRVLYVEDSASLRQTVATALRRCGYAVDVAADGEEGAALAVAEPYDVVVLDIMLPKLDGLAVLRHIRAATRDVPVLMLTARTAVRDRVDGLHRGADDYLGKPFSLEELMARIQALNRRRYAVTAPVITIGLLEIDTARKVVAYGGRLIDMKPREYALLEYLALRGEAVVSRSEIEGHIYDDLVDPMSNVVDSAVCLLRRKLAEAGSPPLIHTRRGLGYSLRHTVPCDPSSGD